MIDTQINSRIINPRRTPAPVALLANATPYVVGIVTAEKGEAFAPEQFFVWDGDMLEYTEGFELVRGESDITRDFKRSIAEAVDYEDDILDREWFRKGQW